jgi:hypothetical protein
MTQHAGTTVHLRHLGVAAAALILSSMFSVEALAQAMPGAAMGAGDSMQKRLQSGEKAEKREAAPDVLPGAKARAPVAPASKTPTDMPPNEAMFDAINRGDIATVKDALSRGADLEAHNVLGMTPLELSVDLGRNDISFLLLSMRGDSGGGKTVAAANPAPALSKKGGQPRTAEATRAQGRRVPTPATVANAPVSTPKLFANDGGTPHPSAGFLGFDSRGGTN